MGTCAAVVACALGGTLLGLFGFVVAVDLVAVVVLLSVRLTVAPVPSARPVPQATPGPAPPPREDPDLPFRDHRDIELALGWADSSARIYDHAARPLVRDIADRVLAARRGIDTRHDPDAVRALVGEELWPLLDPSRPVADDDRLPAPGLTALDRLARRLEEL